MNELNTGLVKWFDSSKGFGFITPIKLKKPLPEIDKPTTNDPPKRLIRFKIDLSRLSQNNDIFFHIKDTRYPSPSENDIVIYDERPSKKHSGKYEAKNVVSIRNSDRVWEVLAILVSDKTEFKKSIKDQIAESVNSFADETIINNLLQLCGNEITKENFNTALAWIDIINILSQKYGRVSLPITTFIDKSIPEVKDRIIVRAFTSLQFQNDYSTYCLSPLMSAQNPFSKCVIYR